MAAARSRGRAPNPGPRPDLGSARTSGSGSVNRIQTEATRTVLRSSGNNAGAGSLRVSRRASIGDQRIALHSLVNDRL